jgi:hypothetical protein
MAGLGIGLGLGLGGGGGGAALTASANSFLASASQGALIASLSNPFGGATTYAAIGAVPGQLAIAGDGTVTKGASAAVVGNSYSLKIRATSADAKREAAETFVFAAAATPTPTPTTPPQGNVGTGLAATSFPVPPATYHYHPTTSVVTQASSAVTGISDLRGKAPLSSTNGPVLATDALGRRYLRWSGSTSQFLQNIADLTGQDPHNMTVFAVVRNFQLGSSYRSAILSVGTNGNSPASHAFAQLGFSATGSSAARTAPFLSGMANTIGTQAPASRNKLIAAAGLQVVGISTATADGVGGSATSVTVRHYCMDQVEALTASIARQTGKVGIDVGRRASGNPGTSTADAFNGDLYELVGWTEGQFNVGNYAAASDAIRDALMSNWGLMGYTKSVVLEGDSRTEQQAGDNFASMLTDPGGPYALPASVRVVNAGVGGTGLIRAAGDGASPMGVMAPGSMLGGGNDIVVDFQSFNDVYGASGSLWPSHLSATYSDSRAQEIYNTTALDGTFTAWIYGVSGIEVTAVSSGYIAVGQVITGPGIPAGTVIASFVSGTEGGPGRYTVTSPSSLSITSVGAAAGMTGVMPTQVRTTAAWLNRGFKVIKAVETANASPGQSAFTLLRGLIRNNLANDVLAGGAQTYAGKLRIADLPAITIGGQAVFGANAVLPGTYYSDATVHFTSAGRAALLSGGDTPANGLKAAIEALMA